MQARTRSNELQGLADKALSESVDRAEQARSARERSKEAHAEVLRLVGAGIGSKLGTEDRAKLVEAAETSLEEADSARLFDEVSQRRDAERQALSLAALDAERRYEKALADIVKQNPTDGKKRLDEALAREQTPQAQKRAERDRAAGEAHELRDMVGKDRQAATDLVKSQRQGDRETAKSSTLNGRVAATGEQFARETNQSAARTAQLDDLDEKMNELEGDPKGTQADPAKRKALAALKADAPRRAAERQRIVARTLAKGKALLKSVLRLIAKLKGSTSAEDKAKLAELETEAEKLALLLGLSVSEEGTPAPTPAKEIQAGAAAYRISAAAGQVIAASQHTTSLRPPDAVGSIISLQFYGHKVILANEPQPAAAFNPVEPPQTALLSGLLCAGCSCGAGCPPGQCACTKTYGPVKMPPPPPPGNPPVTPEGGAGGGKAHIEDYKYGPGKPTVCPPGTLCQARADEGVPGTNAPGEPPSNDQDTVTESGKRRPVEPMPEEGALVVPPAGENDTQGLAVDKPCPRLPQDIEFMRSGILELLRVTQELQSEVLSADCWDSTVNPSIDPFGRSKKVQLYARLMYSRDRGEHWIDSEARVDIHEATPLGSSPCPRVLLVLSANGAAALADLIATTIMAQLLLEYCDLSNRRRDLAGNTENHQLDHESLSDSMSDIFWLFFEIDKIIGSPDTSEALSGAQARSIIDLSSHMLSAIAERHAARADWDRKIGAIMDVIGVLLWASLAWSVVSILGRFALRALAASLSAQRASILAVNSIAARRLAEEEIGGAAARAAASSGGRATQFFVPRAGGLGEGGSVLLRSKPPANAIAKLVDGEWAGEITWVAPRSIAEHNALSRIMTGVGLRRHVVEFDVFEGEMVAGRGVKAWFGPYQNVIPGEVSLTGRNPVFAVLRPNYAEYGVRAGLGYLGVRGGIRGLRALGVLEPEGR
ncbi:MAG: hypothetical protein K1Y01_14625 [Vicinamibacteria bacterium]|nr:hypothetical protein [Vicinamibacteria bacterium]